MRKSLLLLGALALIPACPGTPTISAPPPINLPVEPGEVLIVDLNPQARSQLEAAMKEGIALVTYDPSGKGDALHILDCNVDGKYGFIGTTKQERLIKMDNGNDTALNVPFSALALNAKLGGDFFNKNTLDVAVDLVGIRKTTLASLTKDDLPQSSDCAQATHFIKSTTVGAFAVATTSKQDMKVNAEIWLLAANHENHNDTDMSDKEGDTNVCGHAKASDNDALDGCGAPVYARLERIRPTGTKLKPLPKPPEVDVDDEPCPTEMNGNVSVQRVRSVRKDAQGKFYPAACTSDTKQLHVCLMGDRVDCEAQCNVGEPNSCGKLGYMWQYGINVAKSPSAAHPLYDKACTGGAQFGCAGLGVLLAQNGDYSGARDYFVTACDAGNARGCQSLGALFFNGQGVDKDVPHAMELFKRACAGGAAEACADAGAAIASNTGTNADYALAAAFLKQGCDGNVPEACGMLGAMYVKGYGSLGQDQQQGLVFLDRGCNLGNKDACTMAGNVRTGKDPDQGTSSAPPASSSTPAPAPTGGW
jgi:TPR repeat protein